MNSPRVLSARSSRHSPSPNRSHVPKHMDCQWKSRELEMPTYFQMTSPRVLSARSSRHSLSPKRSHVPKHMGWQWKTRDLEMPNCFQLMPGWRPGVIQAATLKQMKKHSSEPSKKRKRRRISPAVSPTRCQESIFINTATVRMNSSHSNRSARSRGSSVRSSSYQMEQGSGIVRLTRHRNGNYAVTFHKTQKKSCKDKVKAFFSKKKGGSSSSNTSVSAKKKYVAQARFNGVDIERTSSRDSFVFDFPVKNLR